MTSHEESVDRDAQLARTLETTVRIGIVLLLIAWCFLIISPFLLPIAWAAIIAVALYPAQQLLAERIGSRPNIAALITTLLLLMLLIAPMVLLGDTLVETSIELAKRLREGSLTLPSPPERLAGWPLIGAPLYEFWTLASNNITAALSQLVPYLKPVAGWLVKVGTGAGFGLLQTLAAILIAGVLLARANDAKIVSGAIVRKMASARGAELADLVEKTVRSVATGILGIAIVQSILAGLGMWSRC